jgi:hypothetical protein
VTLVLADGQNHGRAAKRVSHLVVTKALELIADGIRDGAVARGAHDYLYALRDGKVSTELVKISADVPAKSLVITRNTHVPVLVRHVDGRIEALAEPVEAIGVYENTKPVIAEVPMAPGVMVVAFTDGIYSAGRRYDRELNPAALERLLASADPERVQQLADEILSLALEHDQGRPADDMSVVAVGLVDAGSNLARRVSLSMPTE